MTRVAYSNNKLYPRTSNLPDTISLLVVEMVWTMNKDIQNQNTARRGAARRKFVTLNFSQRKISMTNTKELPASTNVPVMLTVFSVSCLKTAFPQVSVVVSFVRQTNAGTIKRTVNSDLASNSKEKTEATTNDDRILVRKWKLRSCVTIVPVKRMYISRIVYITGRGRGQL